MLRWVTLVGVWFGCVQAWAQPEVPDGFTARRIAPSLDAERLRLAAIDDPAFGTGVISATTSGDIATFRLISPTGTITVLGTVSESQLRFVKRVRFDEEGIVDGLVHATLTAGPQNNPNRVTYVTIDAEGAVVERWREGGSGDQVDFDFEFTGAQSGNPAGVILLDGDVAHGTELAWMDTAYGFSVVAENSLPPGRTDTDVWGVRRDVTGLYGGGILIAESDPNHDGVSAIYELRDVADGGTYREVSLVPHDVRRYGDLDIAASGAFAGTVWVTDQHTDEVQRVDPLGTHTTWATGFSEIGSMSISPDGDSMYVADANGVWLVREGDNPPGPIVLAQDPSTANGSILTGEPVRSVRVVFSEAVEFTDDSVVIVDRASEPVAFDASGSGSQFMLIAFAEPLDGDVYTVTVADSVVSADSGLQLDGDGDGRAGGDAVLVFEHRCVADTTGDGVIDTRDVIAFLNEWAGGCP